ncbi:hypothetical protein EYE42_10005 [Paracoccus subflavus]|uniref:Uncharacterized protein n=1 Tax=Paracoccus subflavus TaxID=2528244 RepID=A0A4Q9G1G2_9RHOB|nr:hypothetical protein [Paracoccus subflavus]TBN39975.1 hypothetical protein EYE42_10005 [Paracoccus subflavus]
MDLGFEMVRFSGHLRHAWSKEKAESHARQVGDLVPHPGHVQILFFTDKQYALSPVFHGKQRSKAPAEKPAQLVLL